MASQLWDLSLTSQQVPVTGAGDTNSAGADSGYTTYWSQTWNFTYWDNITQASGFGNTDSTAVDSGISVNNPVSAAGSGNTSSTAVGSGTAQNSVWYTITGSVVLGSDGIGNTISQSVDSGVAVNNPVAGAGLGNTTSISVDAGVGTNNPIAGSGLGNIVSAADDYAPFTVISPPSVTGFGDTVSTGYGFILRSFNTLGSETDGAFDVDRQITESTLVRPTASGDFLLDGLPLPS